MCPEDLVLLVSALAITIAKETGAEELVVYATVFTMLGDALAVYATQAEYLDDLCQNRNTEKRVC